MDELREKCLPKIVEIKGLIRDEVGMGTFGLVELALKELVAEARFASRSAMAQEIRGIAIKVLKKYNAIDIYQIAGDIAGIMAGEATDE